MSESDAVETSSNGDADLGPDALEGLGGDAAGTLEARLESVAAVKAA